jgi:predicted ferric reductase
MNCGVKMSIKSSSTEEIHEQQPEAMPLQDILLVILVVLAAILIAIDTMPLWLPGLAYSTAGSQPKVYWFLSRGSAIAAYWVLWLSMSMGVIITNKMAQIWPGIPPAYEIHQYTGLFGTGVALFHALILTGDQYMNYTVAQVLVPFLGQNYRPTWVGIGQLVFYAWSIVNISFYVRQRIGKKAWRLIHFVSYACFLGAMIHGLMSGTDTGTAWSYYLYWFSAASLLFLTVYRVLIRQATAKAKSKRMAGSS